jgi:membrane protein YqaA with SNARE-associated domain
MVGAVFGIIFASVIGGVAGWFFIDFFAKTRQKLINKSVEKIEDWKWERRQAARKQKSGEN